MDIRIETITPSRAQQYLNRNKSNRKLRDGIVEKYADDMKTGKWTVCPVPIAFYEDGDVADGQHRLWAIIESDTPQKFPIARGLSREDGLNIDTGLGRSVVDNARISGLDQDLSNELLSVARSLQDGQRNSKSLSNAQKLELVQKHREAAQFAVSHGPRGKGLRINLVLSALGRAWYHEQDKEKLKRFCQVLSTGFASGDHESAAIAFRNYLMSKGRSDMATLWRENFLKAQNAISYFMHGKKLMVIKGVADEAYPLLKSKK